MFSFNLLNFYQKPAKSKHFEPLTYEKYKTYIPQAPREIRKMIKSLSKCPNCNFLIFDNYWSDDIEKPVTKNVCPTCGNKF
jgi:predicted RNA-binding Zn-ribbon protein involved in translation (DUF1610 family)